MLKNLMLFIFMIFVMAACNGGEQETSEQPNGGAVQPMHFDEKTRDIYDRQGPSIGEQGGYPQSKQRGVNSSDFSEYSDAFTNEESIRIMEELVKQKDIIQAQVASTDDRIIVAVMLRENLDREIADDIEAEVKEIVPASDKEVIVYTDDVQWDRMKNFDSRIQSEDMDEDTTNFMEEFFHMN
ncbi:YhcN/YlaJ family sporulation lipoprotein [Oceanobacillus rekensis]|uniref:YhcN/YlaJ family sporulation lipoprotein n=1 Tax=Oceanobacillus rekensis TaxID=937927 RepID=UPI000B4422D5|nr:YhcN/YlaJ family sporulation lipoprotein [Oceanobacillus rekensis]